MNRRESLKILGIGAISAGVIAEGCKPSDKKDAKTNDPEFTYDRAKEELEREKQLLAQDKFFTKEEMATITILVDIIIPKDEVSGSATDAKVPDFIEFIVKDMPSHQVPMRGGLRWLDMQCLSRYGKAFRECDAKQQIEMVDLIAYPNKAKFEMSQGVAFFNRMRNLTASGFYTSEIGVADIGYAGNTPNQWNGVPDEVLKQYGLSYTEKELKECVKFDS
ncbi:gluconate 2-dehydrogenase subunit 3 family protein [Pedobacter montanisoli]|uniref:Gluconate 2-dehydrogenase subunit 3 family protein n=1 Tax=Pedobacter montanisoli TaxID=2923277 RepID=A0ABS9ZSN5_9SPHI|nr:gluconate 2-dehydrogenase subunit 3 family protein [Pedobacter montanisoli]MCJ0741605.1 gluconate 2-dehydrogenase subunit 3 family protein [Pedobacter montanisoli]